MNPRKLPAPLLGGLVLAPVGALSLAAWLQWEATPVGRDLGALLVALAGGSGVAALAFALDALRVRRAFGHLRSGGGALGHEAPERQRLREQRQHETVVQLRRQVELLSAIRDLALIANDDVCFERILERALSVLGGLLDAREIAIYLQEGAELVPVAWRRGEKNRVRGKKPLKVEPREAAEALDARRTVVSQSKGAGLRAATLLVADGAVMGALEVRLARAPRWAASDPQELTRQLESLAKHIALAIRKPTLYDRAVVDGLTRLYTKRHFKEQAAILMAQRARLGTPLSLIILDIDHFKSVNDTHGHVAGDLVLAEVARRLRKGIRAYDLAFRYGGEEMIVLAPDTPKADATALAERLRRSLRRTKVDAGETSLRVTASFGVAEYDPERHGDLSEFLEEADQHLYHAKRSGRDRVVADLPPTEAASEAPTEAEGFAPDAGPTVDAARAAQAALPTPPEAFRTRRSA